MKKWVVKALLVCLATGTFLSGVSAPPAMGAGAATSMKKNSQVAKSVSQPVHNMIIFNDYQVAGQDSGGWNWVKNDEFILPPDTPLDIDLLQTTYGSGTNLNKSEVMLDGVAMPEYQAEQQSSQSTFRWQVPRFSIPAAKLTAGQHTLTFVVSDAKGQKSTVHVRFQVEAQNYPSVFEGEKAEGEEVPAGRQTVIFGMMGSTNFASKVPGMWKITNKATGAELKAVPGTVFATGTLANGEYDLVFTPDDRSMSIWTTNIRVGMAELYLGTDANGQKLVQGQQISAPAAPGVVSLYSPVAGRWSANGTGQTLTDSQHFEVAIPEMMAGMTMTVIFEPNQTTNPDNIWGSSATEVKIQVPGAPNSCDPSSATATMDVLMQQNAQSSMMVERENLSSSDITVKLYQRPVHVIWLATAAEHVVHGSEASDDEGPGFWAVDNVVVDESKLNWDHTALLLSSYKPGRLKVNYYSKREPRQSWCGYIQVIEDARPIPAVPACDKDESGLAPTQSPLLLINNRGKEYRDGQTISVNSLAELDNDSELRLKATYAKRSGNKKLRDGTGRNGTAYYMPNLVWTYGETPVGSNQTTVGATISSDNTVQVFYEGQEIALFESDPDDEYEDKGMSSLDLRQIIEDNDGKAGVYTIKVTNHLTYKTCSLVLKDKKYVKDLNVQERNETMSLKVEVK
ncbi:hypothetical protein AV540_18920 [Brevibacillus parabrevis]|uniref:hypothetical protein n=1 Tax=Brevibacillus parabrevis TaxID=54914 RepID=UPI0007AB5E95|nr:hypothetical protein [Brevibacillus parabrevis]KZE47479.1 hypothetical protein AV540_18920 [Brevibacillus parabrevis]